MSFFILIPFIIILGAIVYYIYYIAPKINPLSRADNYLNQGMIDDAILEYKKILDNDLSNFVVHYKLGNIYFKQDMIDQGVIHFEEILKINKFNFEVEKVNILRELATSYLARDEIENAFQHFLDILNQYPNDQESLYHVSFIALGQELFEFAKKYFDKLVKVSKKNFEILFGAGMASFQEQVNNDAFEYFKDAINYEPHSDIGNIALAFSLQKKRDFKTALNYLKMIIDNTEDINANFISRRLMGIIQVQSGKYHGAEKTFQDLQIFIDKNELNDETVMLLYDLGFASLRAEKSEQAYEYWNQCYQNDRNYKNVQKLIHILRKEMDTTLIKKPEPDRESADDYVEEWISEAFPENFLWKICGLKSKFEIDLRNIRITTRISSTKDAGLAKKSNTKGFTDPSEILERFTQLDLEKFRIISNRVILKLGYSVDEFLNTYKDSDGVDFIARSTTNDTRVLVWVRRWKDTKVGEIPLRNFAQAINDIKASKGLFLTISELSSSAESALKRLSKVRIIYPDELKGLLAGLI